MDLYSTLASILVLLEHRHSLLALPLLFPYCSGARAATPFLYNTGALAPLTDPRTEGARRPRRC